MRKLWDIVKDREAWRAAVHGVTKSRSLLSDWTKTACVCVCIKNIYLNNNKKKNLPKILLIDSVIPFLQCCPVMLRKITQTIQTKPKQKWLWSIGFQNVWSLPADLKDLFLCCLFLLHSVLAPASFLFILKSVKVTSTLCTHSVFKPCTLSPDSQNECLLPFKVQIQFKETFVNKEEEGGEEGENSKDADHACYH